MMAFIFVASSVPGTQVPALMWDKLAHLLVYAALGASYLVALSGGRPSGVTANSTGLAIVLSFLYGLSDEVHQMFTPGRSPDVLDVAADTVGAGAGAVFVWVLVLIWRALGLSTRARPRQPENPGT
jgi:VanZ family protein